MSSAISWNPSRELKAIQPRLHRSLSGALARIGDENRSRALWTPAVDVHETDREYEVKVDRNRFSTKVTTRVLGTSVALLLFWVSLAAAQSSGARPTSPSPTAKPAPQTSPAKAAAPAGDFSGAPRKRQPDCRHGGSV